MRAPRSLVLLTSRRCTVGAMRSRHSRNGLPDSTPSSRRPRPARHRRVWKAPAIPRAARCGRSWDSRRSRFRSRVPATDSLWGCRSPRLPAPTIPCLASRRGVKRDCHLRDFHETRKKTSAAGAAEGAQSGRSFAPDAQGRRARKVDGGYTPAAKSRAWQARPRSGSRRMKRWPQHAGTLCRSDLEQGRMREIYLAAVDAGRALNDEQLSTSLVETLARRPKGSGWWVFAYGSLL